MNAKNRKDLEAFARNYVLNEVKDLLDIVIGGERTALALGLESTESLNSSDSWFELEALLKRCHDFAFEASQGGDDKADQEMLEAFSSINLEAVAVEPSNTDSMSMILTLLEAHQGRMKLEFPESDGDLLTREQISLLSGFAVETIRLAAFADGNDCLPQQRGGLARSADVKRWLKHKGRYQEFKRLPPFVLKPEKPAADEVDLATQIRGQVYRHLDTTAQVYEILSKEEDRQAFEAFFKSKRFDPNNIGWVTPGNAQLLGSPLRIDAKWLFENLHRLASKSRRQLLLSMMSDETDEGRLRKAPDDTVVTAELIRRVLMSHSEIQRHPAERKPNVKLDGYLVSGGSAFAHEHNGKSQFLWVPESLPVTESVVRKHYPALGPSQPAARHSGLLKFPELGRTAIKKVHVKSPTVLNDIVEALLAGGASR